MAKSSSADQKPVKPAKKSAEKPHSATAKSGKEAGKETTSAKASITAAKQAETKPEVRSESKPAPAVPPEPQESPMLPAGGGKVSVFGGPKDRGVKPDDKLALPTGQHFVYERFKSLNPQSFYCSMRWEYHVLHMTPEEVKRWWANKKVLITNAKSNVSVVARAVDWGPHEKTGLDVGISPGTAKALGVEVGDEVKVELADPKSPLGPVAS